MTVLAAYQSSSKHHELIHQNSDATLLQEIDELKRALLEKEAQLLAMQEADRQIELEDSIIAWQDKYERLYESHKRVQKVNQNLEDKLLKLVERGESKNAQLTSDVATLSVRLAQANYNISLLQREIVSTRLSPPRPLFHSTTSLPSVHFVFCSFAIRLTLLITLALFISNHMITFSATSTIYFINLFF